MGRMPKHKAAKAAVSKRRSAKKAARRTPGTAASSTAATTSLAESIAMANAAAGSASPTGSVSTAGGSTPSSSAKECEQCGNPTMLDGVASSKSWSTNKKLLAANGCQICDFVMYSKTLRPCVHCERTNCEHFCEWCGNGYHTKCARARDEKVNAPNGFCCRKCEAEQADDDEEKDPAVEEIGSRCGSCRLPFNSTAKEIDEEEETKSEPEESGFKVNQSVLVENEEVLYNAVITEVDMKGERIKIHFIRWSKSFDNWYAMDDERINESLACDCCNHWFHIGCLPPIKSSGRFKDTTYVCPTCIDDAKHFHNGTRSSSKAKAAALALSSSSSGIKASTRKSSVSEDAPVVIAATKRKSSRPIITSDDEQETKKLASVEKDKQPNKKKRKLSITSDSPVKKKPEISRSKSRSKSPDPPTLSSPQTTAPSTTAKATSEESESARQEEQSVSEKPALPTEPAAVAVIDSRETGNSAAAAATSTAKPAKAKTIEKAPAEDAPEQQKAAESTSSSVHEDASSQVDNAPHRRKASSHSVSSLLNSPSPNEKPATPPVHVAMSSFSMLDESRRNLTSSFDVYVKVEREGKLAPLPSSYSSRASSASSLSSSLKPPTSVAKLEPYQNSNWPMRASLSSTKQSSSSGRGSLSAFDILREVATQSIGGELDAVAAPAPKAKKPRVSAAKAKALKAEKTAAAAAAKAGGANGSSNGPSAAGVTATAAGASSAEQERLFQSKERIHLNSFVDLHFSIRKEMYLKFCMLEEQGLLDRDTAQLLRSLIYPTSDKFQDLKFVYMVNKDLSPLYLTKRLLEVVPTSLGGTGQAPATVSGTGSVASSPASTSHTSQPMPTIVPSGLTIPSFSEIIASEKAAALHHQQQQQSHMNHMSHMSHASHHQSHSHPSSSAPEPPKKSASLRPDVIAMELQPPPPRLPPQHPSTSTSSVQSQP